jgi:hypothetical protein
MSADKAHYERLVEAAAIAQQRCVAANFACAMRDLYSTDNPMTDGRVKEAAEAAKVANEALMDWRVRHPAE